MEVKSTAKTLRIPPRKARIVIDLIRGKDAAEAAAILKFTPNVAAEAVGKVLKSAVANAVNNHDMDEEKLYVKACYANEGVTLKRFMPRAKGSASAIHKRTSHITVVVETRIWTQNWLPAALRISWSSVLPSVLHRRKQSRERCVLVQKVLRQLYPVV